MSVLRRAPRRVRLTTLGAALAASVLGVTMLVSPNLAAAALSAVGGPAVPAPPASPTSADQIQNVDQVKTAIKAYYGDRADTVTVDPVTGLKDLHTFNPDGAYAHEVEGIATDAEKYLAKNHTTKAATGTPAILFDIDDTTLNTYNYEIFSNFVFKSADNAAFVNAGVFPAVPGMVDLANQATAEGYTVFFLTGRPEGQRVGTKANLASVGYGTVPDGNLYLKDLTAPWLSSCATTTPTCTTIQYKSLTRQHIESMGYDIVANLGDQFSDLTGGFADRTFKIPNPNYFLP